MSGRDTVIFDLDGTLVDSAVLCVGIINEMLQERGSERFLTVEMAKPYMSCGGAHLVSNMLGEDCRDLTSDLADFRRRYAAMPTPEDSLFEGVRSGLAKLSDAGMKMAICSNKPQTLCEKIVTELALDPFFSVIVGGRDDRRQKPHPEMLELAIASLQTTAGRCLLVGDSEQDHALAEAAGIPLHFVTYGYPSPGWSSEGLQRHDRFDELIDAILRGRSGAALHDAA